MQEIFDEGLCGLAVGGVGRVDRQANERLFLDEGRGWGWVQF